MAAAAAKVEYDRCVQRHGVDNSLCTKLEQELLAQGGNPCKAETKALIACTSAGRRAGGAKDGLANTACTEEFLKMRECNRPNGAAHFNVGAGGVPSANPAVVGTGAASGAAFNKVVVGSIDAPPARTLGGMQSAADAACKELGIDAGTAGLRF